MLEVVFNPAPTISEHFRTRSLVRHEVPGRSGDIPEDLYPYAHGFVIEGILDSDDPPSDKNKLLQMFDLAQTTANFPVGRISFSVEGHFGVTASSSQGAIIESIELRQVPGHRKPRFRYRIRLLWFFL